MFLACSLAAALCVSSDVLAVTAQGEIYRVDSNTASVTLLNSVGLATHCLARATDGRMWSLADLGSGLARLIEVDAQSGATSTLAVLDLGGVARGASFDADGALFALVRPLSGGADRLVRIDMTTLALTDIGSTGIHTLEDLCVAPEGRLYAWDSGPGGANGIGLVELSRSSGAALDIAPAGGSSDVLALAIDEVGELRGANFKLYAIERASGVDQPTSPDTQISFEGFQFLAGMSRIDGALALERTGGLRRVNTSTGAVGPSFTTLSGNLVAAAFFPSPAPLGQYFVFRDVGASTEILSVDPSTGSAASLATIALDGVQAAYSYKSPFTTELWVVTDGGPGQSDRRHKIALPSFAFTPGSPLTGFSDVLGVSVDFAQHHIGWDRVQGAFGFALSIAAAPAELTPGPTSLTGLSTLRHDPQGRLFAASNSLQRLTVMSESASAVGSAALGELVGLDFMAAPQTAAPATYCTATTNSLGCFSRVSTSGPLHPSASEPSGFEVIGFDLVSQKQGLLFYGLAGRAAVPFSSGFLCVKSPLRRTGLQNSGGVGGCDGRFTLDFNAWVASGVDPALGPGTKVNTQYWSRDPAAPSTTNVTNALEFVLAP